MVSCYCHSLSANQWNRNVNLSLPLSLKRIGWYSIQCWNQSLTLVVYVRCLCALAFIVHHTENPRMFLGVSLPFIFRYILLLKLFRFSGFFAARLSTAINDYNIKMLLMKWANRVNQRKCLDKYLFIWYNFCRQLLSLLIGRTKMGSAVKKGISVSENGPKNLLM